MDIRLSIHPSSSCKSQMEWNFNFNSIENFNWNSLSSNAVGLWAPTLGLFKHYLFGEDLSELLVLKYDAF